MLLRVTGIAAFIKRQAANVTVGTGGSEGNDRYGEGGRGEGTHCL